ncbi:MAG: HdeD family acid-resistance protein [Candidatus Sericytochromatia bacterium]
MISLIRNWWAVGVVGALAIVLGLAAFFMPLATLASLVVAFGAYALASGVFQVLAGATGEAPSFGSSRAWIVTTGVLSIIAGLITLFSPGITAAALYTVIAVWAILGGLTQVAAAVAHRHQLKHTWLVALGGVAMAVFGVYLLLAPAGVLALAYAIGAYAVTYGVLMLVASFQLKRAHDYVEVTLTREGRSAALREEERTRR